MNDPARMAMDPTALRLKHDVEWAKNELLDVLSDGMPHRAYWIKSKIRGVPSGAVSMALDRLMDEGTVRVIRDDWVTSSGCT